MALYQDRGQLLPPIALVNLLAAMKYSLRHYLRCQGFETFVEVRAVARANLHWFFASVFHWKITQEKMHNEQ